MDKVQSNVVGCKLFDYIHFLKIGFCEKIVKYLFIQVLEAVNLCHTNGIIHSDIKLENILLSNTLELKLIDFCCAKEINGNDFRQYKWSPEVHYSPETLGYDGVKNDIFSLGIMLFTLLFGFYPFAKPNISKPISKLFIEEEYCTFWAKFENTTQCSENFKDLFKQWFVLILKKKINLDEIKNHPWLTEDDKDNCLLNHEIFEKEFYRRKRIVDERKKKKYW
jgi:serine/threonine protein kinase